MALPFAMVKIDHWIYPRPELWIDATNVIEDYWLRPFLYKILASLCACSALMMCIWHVRMRIRKRRHPGA
jgi:hypothetical protein